MILELRKFDLDLHAALETFPLVLSLFACLPLILSDVSAFHRRRLTSVLCSEHEDLKDVELMSVKVA